jgi:hypothetical protein
VTCSEAREGSPGLLTMIFRDVPTPGLWPHGSVDKRGDVLKAPDDESISAFLLELASAGNVRSTTLRAYDREEISRIIGRIS